MRAFELRRVVSVALVLLPSTVLFALAACSSSEEQGEAQGAPTATAPPPSAPATGNVNPQVAPTATAPKPDADTCEDLGQRQGIQIAASYDNGDQWFWGSIAGRPTPTQLGILGSASSAQTVGEVVQLGVGAEANYATCTHCIAIAVGCIGDDCSAATWFFAKSGTSRFDNVATAPGGTFSGEFDNVVLTQVTVDQATFVSTEVTGGGCFRIPKATFQATTEAVSSGPAPDGGADNDGGSSDGGPLGDGGSGGSDGGTVNDGGSTGSTNNGNHGGRNGGTGGAKTKPTI